MIIVAGHLRVATADRDGFIACSREAVELARNAAGCHDFAVSAGSVDPKRINVYERRTDRAAQTAFRGDGPDDELNALIVSADVRESSCNPESRARSSRSGKRIHSRDGSRSPHIAGIRSGRTRG